MTTVIVLGLVGWVIAAGEAWFIQQLMSEKKAASGRRGVLSFNMRWWKSMGKYQDHGWNDEKVVCVVKELDKVSGHSKIEVLDIQASCGEAESLARGKVAQWVETDNVVWDMPTEPEHFVVPEKQMDVPEHKPLSVDERVDIILKEDIRNL